MKFQKIFAILLCLISFDFFGQCSFTTTPNQIYYPNSVHTPSVFSFMGVAYLCGPNTVLNDTLGNGCYTLVNPNCTLTIKPDCSYCPAYITVWAKNNSVVNIMPGNCNLLYIYSEPLATINNPFNVQYQLAPCTAINFANVNCGTTQLNENSDFKVGLNIFPNPVCENLNLSFNTNSENKLTIFSIYNCLGQFICKHEIVVIDNKASIITNELKNGYYFLVVDNGKEVINSRFVINK